MALVGKSAVITGAVGGIGFATATHYLKEGVKNLALLDIHEDAEKVERLRKKFSGANITFSLTDITKKHDIERTFKNILDKFKQIDIVVNGAGILREDDIERIIATNLFGLINTSIVAMNAMSKANGGNGGLIVNIASVAGFEVAPGIPIYNATKHGVVGFTRSLAHNCYFSKHGVKFTIVCPGVTDTAFLAEGKKHNTLFPEAREISEKILKIVPIQTADECGAIIAKITACAGNGSIWIVDGGKYTEITVPKLWKL